MKSKMSLLIILALLLALPAWATISQSRADTTYLDSSQTLRVRGTVIFSPAASGGVHIGGLRDTVGAIIGDSTTLWGRDSTSLVITDSLGTVARSFNNNVTLGDAAADVIAIKGTLADSMRVGTGDWIGLTGAAGRVRFYDSTVDCVGVLNAVFSSPATTFIKRALPPTNDAGALGSGTLGWSDLHLARQGAIGWNNLGMSISAPQADESRMSFYYGATEYVRWIMSGGGQLTIDTDGTMNEGDHHLEIHNSTNCSEINASETSWTNCTPSSRSVKADITEVDADSVLVALRTVKPYRFRYRGDFIKTQWPDPDTISDPVRRNFVRSSIERDSTMVRNGYMNVDMWRLRHALDPATDPGDTLGYSLDPIVQAQQIAILELLERTDDESFGGVPIGQVVAGLAAAVAALAGWVGTLKKQINGLEARIAKLEGVAPTSPNPEV